MLPTFHCCSSGSQKRLDPAITFIASLDLRVAAKTIVEEWDDETKKPEIVPASHVELAK